MSILFNKKAHRFLNCIRAWNVNSIAFYSRRNNPRNSDGNDRISNYQFYEPNDNRFFLPGSLGQSWQVKRNIRDICLTEVVDYFNQSTNRLHIETVQCPLLLRSEIQALFPGGEAYSLDLTRINLSYKHFQDEEKGQKFFYTAAKVICHRVMIQGYWADFINPYTGKAEYDDGKQRNKTDIQYSSYSSLSPMACVYIKADKGDKNGIIYTDAPIDLVDRYIYDL